MRSLLTFAAVAMIALAVGCNGTEEESGTTDTTPTKTEAKETDTSKTETPATGEIKQVSLKVPGMT